MKLQTSILLFTTVVVFVYVCGCQSSNSVSTKYVRVPHDNQRMVESDVSAIVKNAEAVFASRFRVYRSTIVEVLKNSRNESLAQELYFAQFGLEDPVSSHRIVVYLQRVAGKQFEYRLLGWHPLPLDPSIQERREVEYFGVAK